jgi:PIN domain nuclease of toxin-antitoxin system
LNGYLLDTSIALTALAEPGSLSRSSRRAVLRGPNVLSVVSYWEVLLKSMKGSLDVGDLRAWWHDALEQLVATPLPLRLEHVARVYTLPPIHKDPFDRILIAQAAAEGLALVTSDDHILLYGSAQLKVVC